MIKNVLPFFIIASLLLSYPSSAIAATPTKSASSSTANKKTIVRKSTSSVKTPTKPVPKKTTKKKSTKKAVRKERLIAAPPLFTIDTAPHSPKPIVAKAKKKTIKKSLPTKKKV